LPSSSSSPSRNRPSIDILGQSGRAAELKFTHAEGATIPAPPLLPVSDSRIIRSRPST
jgi:hypothetical protein